MKIEKLALLIPIIITISLAAGCPQPSAKLKVSRNEVKQGDPVTVSWETKNAKTTELNGEKVQAIGAMHRDASRGCAGARGASAGSSLRGAGW